MTDVIKRAVRDPNLIVPYYHSIQNIVGETLGHEVLMRIVDEGTVYSPAEIFPEIKRQGFMNHFQFEIIKKAIEELKNSEGYIFINISEENLKHPTLTKSIIQFFNDKNVKDRIVLEILEDDIDFNDEFVSRNLLYLKINNINLAIDDFGSEYSFFKRLLEFPYRYIKIDREFIKERNEYNKEIISSLAAIAKKHGKAIICEGIETIEDLNYIKEAGIEYFQGFYFSTPAPQH